MHTRLVLCVWILGIVSAVDDKPQGSDHIDSKNGIVPVSSDGQASFGVPVSSNNVKVLPNAYKTSASQSLDTADNNGGSSIAVPVVANSNTPLQGNINQPVPVPVSYPDELVSETNADLLTVYRRNPIQISPNATPVPVFVKAPPFRPIVSSPRPFKVTSEILSNSGLQNPFSNIQPSFRLWPKLPEPVPVPVLTANAFIQKSYQNFVPKAIPLYHHSASDTSLPSNGYQQNPVNTNYLENSQNQGHRPIYFLTPVGNNNAQNSYQSQVQSQASYPFQEPQSGNQSLRYIILSPPNSGSQYSDPSQDVNQSFASSSNQPYPGGQSQVQSGQLPPIYAVFAPPSLRGSQSQDNPAGQSPPNYGGFAPVNSAVNSGNLAMQSPLVFAASDPSYNPGKSSNALPSTQFVYSPQSQSPSPFAASSSPAQSDTAQYVSYSSPSQSPSPQYIGYPTSTQSPAPQYAGYSPTTPTPNPQYVGYQPPNQSPPSQYVNYPTPTQSPSPQYVGYSPTTPSPSSQYVSSPQPQSPSPQYVGYPSPTQPSSPQYVNYPSPTQSPSQQSVNYPSPAQSPSQQYVNYPSPTQSPSQQYVNYPSPAQSPSPQYANYPSPPQSPSPQYVSYPSPNQSPSSQYVSYPSSPQSPSSQYISYPSPPQSPSPQYANYPSPNQAPSPQYIGYPSPNESPSPQYVGYPSPTQSPSPQYVSYPSPNDSPSPQYASYPTPTQSPQYAGSPTPPSPQFLGNYATPAPAPSTSYTPSPTVSQVRFSGNGNSYSYSI